MPTVYVNTIKSTLKKYLDEQKTSVPKYYFEQRERDRVTAFFELIESQIIKPVLKLELSDTDISKKLISALRLAKPIANAETPVKEVTHENAIIEIFCNQISRSLEKIETFNLKDIGYEALASKPALNQLYSSFKEHHPPQMQKEYDDKIRDFPWYNKSHPTIYVRTLEIALERQFAAYENSSSYFENKDVKHQKNRDAEDILQNLIKVILKEETTDAEIQEKLSANVKKKSKEIDKKYANYLGTFNAILRGVELASKASLELVQQFGLKDAPAQSINNNAWLIYRHELLLALFNKIFYQNMRECYAIIAPKRAAASELVSSYDYVITGEQEDLIREEIKELNSQDPSKLFALDYTADKTVKGQIALLEKNNNVLLNAVKSQTGSVNSNTVENATWTLSVPLGALFSAGTSAYNYLTSYKDSLQAHLDSALERVNKLMDDRATNNANYIPAYKKEEENLLLLEYHSPNHPSSWGPQSTLSVEAQQQFGTEIKTAERLQLLSASHPQLQAAIADVYKATQDDAATRHEQSQTLFSQKQQEAMEQAKLLKKLEDEETRNARLELEQQQESAGVRDQSEGRETQFLMDDIIEDETNESQNEVAEGSQEGIENVSNEDDDFPDFKEVKAEPSEKPIIEDKAPLNTNVVNKGDAHKKELPNLPQQEKQQSVRNEVLSNNKQVVSFSDAAKQKKQTEPVVQTEKKKDRRHRHSNRNT